MIESSDVLELCNRFKNYLMPTDLYILRQRYNGLIFKSTYRLGREMKISDETVRAIEARALGMLSHCCNLREDGVKIEPIRLAKTFLQPTANLICQGDIRVVSCAKYITYQGELIIHASAKKNVRTKHNQGTIVGRALLLFCSKRDAPDEETGHEYDLAFAKPQLFTEPVSCRGQQAFFYVPREVAKKLPKRYQYTYQKLN